LRSRRQRWHSHGDERGGAMSKARFASASELIDDLEEVAKQ
jgi:hypothetical protein